MQQKMFWKIKKKCNTQNDDEQIRLSWFSNDMKIIIIRNIW